MSSIDIDNNKLAQILKENCAEKDEILESYAFLIRYCFSCLVDADTIDTIKATTADLATPLKADFEKCRELLETRYKQFNAVTELQKARTRLKNQALENITEDSEIYLMNMPTGSGKTLAGLSCALQRQKIKNKKRIIYVIPYNSIIDQTANEFEDLFNSAAQILRHQSSFSYEDVPDLNEDYRHSFMAACENWDAPIIITTAVQFFESVYSSKRGKLRKMHNMADSILVFDEAHLMPIEFLQPCLRAVAFITKYLNSEALFLTATMPDFEKFLPQYALKKSRITNLIPNRSDFQFFLKNTYVNLGTITNEHLIQHAQDQNSALIVVNSRSAVRLLYDLAAGKEHKYQLTTYLTAYDRNIVIGKIKADLRQIQLDFPDGKVPPERRILVISTSLIEAGIDLDFSAAYRELAGLDNVLQTGGRCNREGLSVNANVYIFEREENTKAHCPEQAVLHDMLQQYEDISDVEVIKEYYRRIYEVKKDEIVAHSLSSMCSTMDGIPFKSYCLKLINSPTESIVIPETDESRKLVEDLSKGIHIRTRALQKYCCTVYNWELEVLLQLGVVKKLESGICVMSPDICCNYYNRNSGVQFQSDNDYYC